MRCGSRTLGRLPAVGDETLLHIEQTWSEAQGPRLYGFGSRDERRAFVATLQKMLTNIRKHEI